jgi:hypothetical protein
MNNPVSVSAGKLYSHYRRLGLIGMAAILQCTPLLAVEVDDAAKSNASSSPQADVSWLSGGVGDEAMADMGKVSANYNVHVMLTGPHGNYLAGVPFTVSVGNGQIKVSGVTAGPLLYLKLPAGRYQMRVQLDGAWQTRDIQVSTGGQASQVRFVAKGE